MIVNPMYTSNKLNDNHVHIIVSRCNAITVSHYYKSIMCQEITEYQIFI